MIIIDNFLYKLEKTGNYNVYNGQKQKNKVESHCEIQTQVEAVKCERDRKYIKKDRRGSLRP